MRPLRKFHQKLKELYILTIRQTVYLETWPEIVHMANNSARALAKSNRKNISLYYNLFSLPVDRYGRGPVSRFDWNYQPRISSPVRHGLGIKRRFDSHGVIISRLD